jgi:bifunctional DNA-binding transcriptional regulator/antitoxin component of YhaV-PrlF toxin-antitoxin module
MLREITLSEAGDPGTALLPSEIMDRLHAAPGDRIFAVETESGILLTRCDSTLRAAIEAFEVVRQQYRNTLHDLAG